MTVPRLAIAGRFNPVCLFKPRSIAVIGAGGAEGAEIHAHLVMGGFPGPIEPVDRAEELTSVPDLAVIAGPEPDVIPSIEAIAAKGCYAAIVATSADGPAVGEAARRVGVRILGPHAFGLAIPGIGLSACRSHIPVPKGRLALVSQSIGLTRAVIDWAEPNGVGFCHVIGIGDNEDGAFGLALDWLATDPQAGAIMLEISRIKDARVFISAARAASRFRTVVAFSSGSYHPDADGISDLAFEAALRRAGVLSVWGLEDMLAAAETLSRARPARGEGLAIISNDAGVGRLAVDAAIRHGLHIVDVSGRGLGAMLIEADAGDRFNAAVAQVAADKQVGGVLIAHAPGGVIHAASLAAQVRALPLPVLVCAMGETTGGPLRRGLAEAGLAEFASPELAVLGFQHLVRDRRNRAAARELPGSAVLPLAPDRDAVRRLFDAARGSDRLALRLGEALAVFAAYGLQAEAGLAVPDLAIRVADDAVFGPVTSLGPGGRSVAEAARSLAMDLPPLNLTLAHALIGRGHLGRRRDDGPLLHEAPLAEALVRVSQLIIDFPEIAALEIGLQLMHDRGPVAIHAALSLRGVGEAPGRLAIAPYPTELVESWLAGDERLIVRPIRPEDAEAHAAFFKRLSPTDVRFRFFSAIHELSAERMARLTQVDYDREMAFIAAREATNDTVGVARIVCEPNGRSAEFAVIVQTDMKGKGLATHLMQRLIAWARDRGLAEVVGQILSDNAPMLAFVRHLGFTVRRLPDDPEVMEARLPLV